MNIYTYSFQSPGGILVALLDRWAGRVEKAGVSHGFHPKEGKETSLPFEPHGVA